jgi:hypothetical protein
VIVCRGLVLERVFEYTLCMDPDLLSEPAATALEAAVDGVRTALGHLIKVVEDGALTDLGAPGLVGFLAEFEQVRNTMPVIDRAAIAYGIEQGVPGVLTERSMARVLMSGLRLSAGEAYRRVRCAEHTAERRSMTGEPLGAFRPELAAAQAEGIVSPEQVALIDAALRKVDHCDLAAVTAGEHLLVDAAGKLGPKELAVVAARVVDAIDPDGVQPADEREHQERRFFHLKHRGDGSWAGDFRLTPELGQKLHALLGPLSAPQTTRYATGEGGDAKRQVEADLRTHGQRRHDAVEAMVDRLLRGDDLPESGGIPTTLLIVMSNADYLAGQGVAHYADGSPLSVPNALRLADQADLAWCVKGARGAVLDLFRTRRIASPAQTLALVARDGGCSFPGCDTAPQWCERHHILPWQVGGDTNLANLTLLCRYHHRHFEQGGWTCRLNGDGLPVWIPPKWIDRQRRPILNPRITASNWNPQDPLDLS